jgi:hypothetical protein
MPTPTAPSKTFSITLHNAGDTTMTAIDVPFDPKPVFGKVRAPVVVEVNGYRYRSTIAAMGGPCCFVPLRRSHREAAGVRAGQKVRVTLTLDQRPRTVRTPPDLAAALREAGLMEAFSAMAYTHRREHVEAVGGAKQAATRARRIEACVRMVGERAKRPRRLRPARR